MGQSKCGIECAEKKWQRVVKNCKGYIPPDIDIYRRAFVGIFAEMSECCAEYWTKLIVRRHQLPPRCELLWMLGHEPKHLKKQVGAE